jgi:PAS domain S-box-containing protein
MCDITLPTKIEELKPNKEKYKKDLENIFKLPLDLICIVGLDSYLKRLNPMFSIIFGYTEKELFSVTFLEFIHPEDRGGHLAEMEKMSKG